MRGQRYVGIASRVERHKLPPKEHVFHLHDRHAQTPTLELNAHDGWEEPYEFKEVSSKQEQCIRASFFLICGLS